MYDVASWNDNRDGSSSHNCMSPEKAVEEFLLTVEEQKSELSPRRALVKAVS
jgi:hypothetical protein